MTALKLKEFGPNIWSVDGNIVNIGNFEYRTRMAVIRLSDGNSWIWSPVQFSKELADDIEATAGPIRHIVSPNKMHYLNMKQWADHCPDARVYASPGLKQLKEVENVRFTDTLGDDPHETFANDIDQVIFHNRFTMEEVVFFHKQSKTVLFCDLLQRYEPSEAEGWKGIKRRLDGLVERYSTPREWVWSFWLGKDMAKKARNTVVEKWKPNRLLIAHGDCLHLDATAVVKEALSWAA